MGNYRERTSALFTGLARGFGRKQRPAAAPPSVSPPDSPVLPRTSLSTISHTSSFDPSPAPQTSLIFELPDELLLSILSHISLDPQLNGRYARFCLPYSVGISDCYKLRVQFLRPLSMTCRAMRLQLLPWAWERLDLSPTPSWTPEARAVQRLNTIVNILSKDTFLAINLKFMKVHLPSHSPILFLFVECIKSLPNLHTLEIGSWAEHTTTRLRVALKGVELPQVKTLIIPPTAHPLLQHCHDVEDVVCVVKEEITTSDDFLGSLISNQDSKVKRLVIPLGLWPNPSQFVVACPRLTELTIFHYPYDASITVSGILLDPAGRTRPEISDLVVACEALPYFDTLQILCFPAEAPHTICPCKRKKCSSRMPHAKQWKHSLGKQVTCMKNLAIDCLKSLKKGGREGEERKKTTVRVVMLNSARSGPRCHPGFVKVEEHEV